MEGQLYCVTLHKGLEHLCILVSSGDPKPILPAPLTLENDCTLFITREADL